MAVSIEKARGFAFIDWDDTICENHSLYEAVRRENAAVLLELFAAYGVNEESIRALVHRLDLIKVRRYGLRAERYSEAWLDAYRALCARCGVSFDPKVGAKLCSTAFTVYTRPQRLLPGALCMLEWLRHMQFRLYVWTAGEEHLQQAKVKRSGVSDYFDKVIVVPHKTRKVLLRYLPAPSYFCFVVGNSAASDVLPALEAGRPVLHVPCVTWEYDEAHIDENHPLYLRIESLAEVPQHVGRMLSQTGPLSLQGSTRVS